MNRVTALRQSLYINGVKHARQTNRQLDEIYNAIRLGDLVHAMSQLEQWLSSMDEELVATDCLAIHSTIQGWNDAGMLIAASRAIAATLVRTQHLDMLA